MKNLKWEYTQLNYQILKMQTLWRMIIVCKKYYIYRDISCF